MNGSKAAGYLGLDVLARSRGVTDPTDEQEDPPQY